MNNIDFEKVAETIEKSSPEIKNLMFSITLGNNIGKIAEEKNLEEEVVLKLFDEVGYVILGLKSRYNFADSLLEIGIQNDTASLIAKEIETIIFTKLDKIKNESGEKYINQEEKINEQVKNGVGNSFEEILSNQAKAMRPASAMGYSEAKHVSEAPNNLPTNDKPRITVPNYSGGNDPYREPIV